MARGLSSTRPTKSNLDVVFVLISIGVGVGYAHVFLDYLVVWEGPLVIDAAIILTTVVVTIKFLPTLLKKTLYINEEEPDIGIIILLFVCTSVILGGVVGYSVLYHLLVVEPSQFVEAFIAVSTVGGGSIFGTYLLTQWYVSTNR